MARLGEWRQWIEGFDPYAREWATHGEAAKHECRTRRLSAPMNEKSKVAGSSRRFLTSSEPKPNSPKRHRYCPKKTPGVHPGVFSSLTRGLKARRRLDEFSAGEVDHADGFFEQRVVVWLADIPDKSAFIKELGEL